MFIEISAKIIYIFSFCDFSVIVIYRLVFLHSLQNCLQNWEVAWIWAVQFPLSCSAAISLVWRNFSSSNQKKVVSTIIKVYMHV